MRTIKFMPDWGHQWPLWEDANDKYKLDPSDLGLSESLSNDLRVWYDSWIQHFDSDNGWDSQASQDASENQARELIGRVELELGPGFRVEDRTY